MSYMYIKYRKHGLQITRNFHNEMYMWKDNYILLQFMSVLNDNIFLTLTGPLYGQRQLVFIFSLFFFFFQKIGCDSSCKLSP